MKICTIVRILWPGGVQRIAFAEVEGLKRLGNDVDLIFIRSTKRYIYDSNIDYKLIYTDEVNDRILGRIFRMITKHYLPQRGDDATVDMDLIYNTEHSIKKRYDIIYYFDEFSAFFQKYNKKKFGNKTVVLIHEVASPEKSKILRFVQRRVIRNANIVLTNTEENLRLLNQKDVKNAFEVYPGLVPHDDVPGFDDRDDVAISVTMWDFGRKPEILIEIAKKLRYGKIVLAGSWTDNKYMEKIKKIIAENNLSNKITVTGMIKESELTELYRRARVSIRFGYDEKGPGMGSLESISWGIPLIINTGIGIKEIIKDRINGFIVNENDPEQIANLIDGLFRNGDKWSAMSRQNLLLVNDLSWEKHCLKLNSIFKNLLYNRNG